MNHIDDEQAPLERIAGLPREIRPRTDLWPGIAARIEAASVTAKPARSRFPTRASALAASVLLAVCAGVLLTRPWGINPLAPEAGGLASAQPEVELEPTPVRAALRTAPDARSAGEAEYVAAFREYLAIQPAADQDSLLPQDWVRETSGVLHQAEIELAAALERSPDDPLLQQRMAALRAHQLEWLKRMAAVERNSRRHST